MSQVNFFMTAVDEAEFLSFVLQVPDARLLVGRFHATRLPEVVRSIPPFGQRQEVELVRTSMRSPITLSASGSGDYEGMFLLDLHRDPHIEWNRCYLVDGALHSGRIYTKIGWLQNESENKAMRRWYNSLAAWLKRRYRRVSKVYWIGNDAFAWAAKGGRTFPDLSKLGNHGAAQQGDEADER